MNSRLVLRILLVSVLATVVAVAAFAADSLTDEFDGNTLSPKWQWHLEPGVWDVGATQAGWFHIDAEPNHNLWTTDGASRIYQEINLEEFDVETHLIADWGNSGSTVSGIMVYGPPEDNWVTIKIWGRGMANGQVQYQTKGNEGGNGLTGLAPGFQMQDGRTDIYIRFVKEGDSYTGYFRADPAEDWIVLGPTTFELTPPLQLSLFAGVDGAGAMTVDFEYFRDNINVAPVDSIGKLATTWATIRVVR